MNRKLTTSISKQRLKKKRVKWTNKHNLYRKEDKTFDERLPTTNNSELINYEDLKISDNPLWHTAIQLKNKGYTTKEIHEAIFGESKTISCGPIYQFLFDNK